MLVSDRPGHGYRRSSYRMGDLQDSFLVETNNCLDMAAQHGSAAVHEAYPHMSRTETPPSHALPVANHRTVCREAPLKASQLDFCQIGSAVL